MEYMTNRKFYITRFLKAYGINQVNMLNWRLFNFVYSIPRYVYASH